MYFNISYKHKNSHANFIKDVEISHKLESVSEDSGFDNLINEQRNKIDKINSDIWKKVRWFINDYDFVVKSPIINRAFYKYWEIINKFNIFENYKTDDIIFHCAEAPGGFIQGSNIYLKLGKSKKRENINIVDEDGFKKVQKKVNEPKDYKIYTISLNKDLPQYKTYNLPSYNKCILNKQIYVTYGKDNSGDINNIENIDHVKDTINKNSDKKSFYFITSDLGFDEGTDFNNKEQLHCSSITNCILSAIMLQKEDGCFLLKMFDIFTNTSIHLLYLLNILYKDIYIYKPQTSRPTNSEKYIICKGFNSQHKENAIMKLKEISKLFDKNEKYTSFKIFDTLPIEFLEKIKNMNNNLLNIQCASLTKAIKLCDNKEFIKNYEVELISSVKRREKTFQDWIILYKLNSYISL